MTTKLGLGVFTLFIIMGLAARVGVLQRRLEEVEDRTMELEIAVYYGDEETEGADPDIG